MEIDVRKTQSSDYDLVEALKDFGYKPKESNNSS